MKSTLKTTAAVVRSIAGEQDWKWAEIMGKSIHTIRHLEAGTLKLSPAMAAKMNHETGISIAWLMKGNPKDPVSVSGEKYTKAIYDRAQAEKIYYDKVHDFYLVNDAIHFFAHLRAILANANRNKNYHMAAYQMGKVIGELRNEFGQAEDLFPVNGMATTAQALMETDIASLDMKFPKMKSGTISPTVWKELFKRTLGKRVQRLDQGMQAALRAKNKSKPTPTKKRPSPRRRRKA